MYFCDSNTGKNVTKHCFPLENRRFLSRKNSYFVQGSFSKKDILMSLAKSEGKLNAYFLFVLTDKVNKGCRGNRDLRGAGCAEIAREKK